MVGLGNRLLRVLLFSVVILLVGLVYFVLAKVKVQTALISKKPYLTYIWQNEIISQKGRIADVRELDIRSNTNSYKPKFLLKLEKEGERDTPMIFLFDEKELNNLIIVDSTGKLAYYKDLQVGLNIRIRKLDESYEISVLD